MATWHQQQRPGPLWHQTMWTLVDDKPGRPTSVERFESAEAAEAARLMRGGYVLPPGR